MKKLLFVLVAAFVCSTVNAQVVTSTSYKKDKSKTLWYVKAGMNIAGMSVKDGDGPDALVGYNVGIAFDRPIANSGAFWSSGLQLATKGWKYSEDGDEVKYNANKLELPLTFGYKYNLNDDIAIDARLGGFVNYDVFGKFSAGDESINLGDFQDFVDEEGGDYNRLGAGIQFGVGVWYQHLNFNISFQKGLVEHMEGIKEKNWMISLGYAF